MSKKSIRSRLENLFSNLAEEGLIPSQQATPDEETSASVESKSNGNGWHDLAQLFISDHEKQEHLRQDTINEKPGLRPNQEVDHLSIQNNAEQVKANWDREKSYSGYALEQGLFQTTTEIWTDTGNNSLENGELTSKDAGKDEPAALAVPLKMQGVGNLLLEIVDDTDNREWSEDDRSLVMEVASQLALALDNAQLYMSVQQELKERIRAEQAILRRNTDLATLNQIGQHLSRLATRSEIFELLDKMIGEVLDNSNLYICTSAANQQSLSFPIYRVDGRLVNVPARVFGSGPAEYVMRKRSLMLITEDSANKLESNGIELPDRIPASLLAIPIIAGERSIGAVVIQDFSKENAFDSIHAELLSTVASQAATAIENAELFQQMQSALQAIESRERYQASVARSAALLTEFGTASISEVLKLLGKATQCSRIYFARIQEDERGSYWSATAEWIDESLAYLFDRTRISHIPVSTFSNWAVSLRDKGWIITHASEEKTAEVAFLNHQHIRSTLLLAVPGHRTYPSFIALDQVGSPRIWQNEEINALRLAADAISNTFVREGLLEQLQVTLEETEDLYKASNQLALANEIQEMVSAILSGVRTPDINRAVLLLFEYDSNGKIAQMIVAANWYSGRGSAPPPVGTEYLRAKYEHFFQITTPVFYDDIPETQIDHDLKETILNQNIRALGILPLLSGKRQMGVLLLQSESKHSFSGREKRTYPPLVDQMAIAVENQRLFDQTQKALSETELLYGVANGISQAGSAQDMLALVGESLLPANADRASLIMIESDADGEITGLEFIGGHEVKGDYHQVDIHLPISSLPLVKSLADEPVIISNINLDALDPASRQTLEQFHIAASCLVPLRTSGQLIGILNASSRLPTEFANEDIRLLRIVGSAMAVALEKQRLLRQAQRRALELQTASEIARDTASTLSLDLLLPRIVEMLCERFSFYHASIFLLDETEIYAVIRESTGKAGEELKHRGHKVLVGSRSVVGTVTATGEPFILNDVNQSPMYYPNPLLGDTRSEMGIPLKIGTSVIGALDLQSQTINAFSNDDVTVLQILADQIAIAIENARAYELSQKAIADMREIDRVKSQFLANMSHELRTPLNSIIGFSRVILKGIDGPINEIQSQDLSAIYSSGQHLLSLINDILDLSKIEAGKMELAVTDTNLVDMINSAMSTAVGLVKDKPIKLHLNVPDELPMVRADTTRIRQVLINFLSNAAKFTEEGEIIVEARLIKSPSHMPEVMVTVSDTGPGIAPEDQAKLFLPFSQVDDSPTRKTGGTGLGLSICRSLIDLHKGRIGLLESQAGKGSTFFFTLPVDIEDEPVPVDNHDAKAGTILAIDDDPKVINLYERYLKVHGYRVVPLSNPNLAVEKVKEIRPIAITLDIMMPEKDGWQVMHDLKNNLETREIPIIICSILENQEKGFSMGATDYLVKPFLQEDMLNAINRLNRDDQIREALIVDDDPENLRLVKKMLEKDQGFQVATAQGGIQGWKLIQSRRPEIIILDLFMPDMNGFLILEKLRATPHLRHIPVIVLTGADLSPEQHQQLTDFSQGVITKGYLQEKELLVLLEKALQTFHPPENSL